MTRGRAKRRETRLLFQSTPGGGERVPYNDWQNYDSCTPCAVGGTPDPRPTLGEMTTGGGGNPLMVGRSCTRNKPVPAGLVPAAVLVAAAAIRATRAGRRTRR